MVVWREDYEEIEVLKTKEKKMPNEKEPTRTHSHFVLYVGGTHNVCTYVVPLMVELDVRDTGTGRRLGFTRNSTFSCVV
jgi:hypothetical protein